MPRPNRSVRYPWALPLFLVALTWCAPADLRASPNPDPRLAVLRQRAEKIVAQLALPDAAHAARVAEILVQHYVALQRLDAEGTRDRTDGRGTKAAEATGELCQTHHALVGRLRAELTADQVEQVKDGLTYGVLPLTYRVYQDLVPTLRDEQKRQILAWLYEAREHALTAGSSEEKHRWFGKYKGRINNYLAAAGIDLKQAERDLRERQRAAARAGTGEAVDGR